MTRPIAASQEIKKFASFMEYSLRLMLKDKKPGQDQGYPVPEYLFNQLLQKVTALHDGLSLTQQIQNPDPFWLGKETGDVANAAMMIAYHFGALARLPQEAEQNSQGAA